MMVDADDTVLDTAVDVLEKEELIGVGSADEEEADGDDECAVEDEEEDDDGAAGDAEEDDDGAGEEDEDDDDVAAEDEDEEVVLVVDAGKTTGHLGIDEQDVQVIVVGRQLPAPGPLQLVQLRPQTLLTDASVT